VAAQYRVPVAEHDQLTVPHPVAAERQGAARSSIRQTTYVDDLEQRPACEPSPLQAYRERAGQKLNLLFERLNRQVRAGSLAVAGASKIRHLTDVSPCNLQKYL
jgi:hypothetical protein